MKELAETVKNAGVESISEAEEVGQEESMKKKGDG